MANLDYNDFRRCDCVWRMVLPANSLNLELSPSTTPDHGLIPVRPTGVFTPLDQLFDLAFGEVFPCSDVAVFGSTWSHFPYFGPWGHHSEGCFCHRLSCFRCNDFPYLNPRAEVCKWWSRHFLDKGARICDDQ